MLKVLSDLFFLTMVQATCSSIFAVFEIFKPVTKLQITLTVNGKMRGSTICSINVQFVS